MYFANGVSNLRTPPNRDRRPSRYPLPKRKKSKANCSNEARDNSGCGINVLLNKWGLTDRANPCFGLRRNKETPRDFYAGDIIWNAVYEQAGQDLKDAMDLAYLTGQRPADVLKASTTDLNNGFLMVGQGKTEKRLRIRLYDGDKETDLCIFINGLLDRRVQAGTRRSILITNQTGLRMSYNMLRNRWDEARDRAATKAATEGDSELATTIRKFQFRDIRPKAGSEIEDIKDASRLLGHSTEEMTKKIYRRVGEIVMPTK